MMNMLIRKKRPRKRVSFHKKHILPATLLLFFCIAAAAGLIYHNFSFKSAWISLSTPEQAPVAGNSLNLQSALNVPTQITKIGEDYFLVDCYHNQILTSDNPMKPLTEWSVMTDRINRGHTIAGDGTVYLADDTENNRILVFEKIDGVFWHTQTFADIGVRPHYVVYDERTERFYALSSMTGELYVFFRPDSSPQVALEKVLSIPELNNIYVRSFTIDGDDVYFVSGNRSVIRARLKDLKILDIFPVPDEIAGMIQLTRIQDYFYITVSTDLTGSQDYATILRVKNLSDLAERSWEDIYSQFIGGGTPYYITSFDGHYYMTEHRIPGHGVWQFDVTDNRIENVMTIQP